MIKVVKPGLETTVQDEGRIGYYNIGMPPAGAVDQFAYAVGNMLVGNEAGAASLEMTYMGPELQFQQDGVITLTGGYIPPKINGVEVPMWKAISVSSGDVLSFGIVKHGARSYLAVAGGISVPPLMGSRSTYTLCGIGGYDGRPLKAGDVLTIGRMRARAVKAGTKVPDKWIPSITKPHEIRIVMGLCSYRLTDESKALFLQTEWTVTPEANRVGYRLKGERLGFVPRDQPFGAGSNPSNVVDLGYPIGSIQIPDGVEPIALLNDAVTGGGYATIATIISPDLSRFAQVKTGEKVRFVSISYEEARQVRIDFKQRLTQINEHLEGAM
ncbi:biotin-dependent carboxyltransferase family protein [Desmospora activa]|uniref:Biotin-dependent carboxylase-like uncharacterized protein n=1 Tax=Desmospora activa DSM 45169 TaxID=1121389 RepID=A0A2T4Z6L2_9BACL|nr:biotin-dependent carboxyltransferase family protein [Desmospora activa]PTM57526.1 biotin-dependent carboxylase-like uncharacterized protein [Desmospora activa DSM 45169]